MERQTKYEVLLPYEYYYDGSIRRTLHEFGEKGLNFYDYVLEQMQYQPGDIAIDIGAGLGEDGKNIALRYRPKIVFLLEPASRVSDDLDERYFPIFHNLAGQRLSGVELLPTAALETTLAELDNPYSQILKARTTYIQPIASTAESLPSILDDKVTKLSMIHTIYEFLDINLALEEAVRVMRSDAKGVIVTNGPADKLVFKDILYQAKVELDKLAPDNMEYTAPETVSAKVDYFQAEALLKEYFHEVTLKTYKDTMIITPERAAVYESAFNSYRRWYKPPIINQRRWQDVREKVLRSRIQEEMSSNDGIFRDTIDIGALFFRYPRK